MAETLPPPEVDPGGSIDQVRQRMAELERELGAARALLQHLRELVISKLEASKSKWWERRRALHELEEELARLFEFTPEELARAGVVTEAKPSLLLRTAKLMQAAANPARWRRKHEKRHPR